MTGHTLSISQLKGDSAKVLEGMKRFVYKLLMKYGLHELRPRSARDLVP